MQGGVGARVAALRKARGLSQTGLAQRAAVSYSLLTKIESGHAPATPAVIGALARALRADIPRLTGQPYEAASATSPGIYEPVAQLRRLLLAYDVPTQAAAAPRPLDEVAADVAAMSALRRTAGFKHLAAVLPPLVEELQFPALTAAQPERDRALRLLAQVYYGVECLASGVGYQDVYFLAIERLSWCADQLGDPLLVAAARWGRAGPLMREGAYGAGLRLLGRARDELEADAGGGNASLAVTGSLHLREALVAARAGRADEAWGHLDEAADLAGRVGETDVHDLAFGPSAAVMYAVSVGADLGDGVRALDAAAARTAPLELAPELLGCHCIDLARARLLVGDRAGALRALQDARRASPQQVRHHPQSRETVLAVAAGGRGGGELAAFASWLGIY